MFEHNSWIGRSLVLLTFTALLIGCGGGSSSSTSSNTTPDPFSFEDADDVALSTVITSNTITLSGINEAAPISVTGGEYAIDGGAFTADAGLVSNGQDVQVRATSSSELTSSLTVTLDIGGLVSTFTITTLADETAPTVEVLFPPENSMTEGSTVFIRGTATDEFSDLTNVTINGASVVTTDNYATWEATVMLVDGINILNISSEDSLGNLQTIAAQVRVLKDSSRSEFPNNDIVMGTFTAAFIDSERNQILVGGGQDENATAIFSVDLVSGERTVFSDASTPNSTGTIAVPKQILGDPANDLAYVLDPPASAIYSLDLTTGQRQLVATSSHFTNPTAMIFNPDAPVELLLVDITTLEVVTVDIVTGVVAVFSDIDDPFLIRGLAYNAVVDEMFFLTIAGGFPMPGLYTLDLLLDSEFPFSGDNLFADFFMISTSGDENYIYVATSEPGIEKISVFKPEFEDAPNEDLSNNSLPDAISDLDALYLVDDQAGLGYLLTLGSTDSGTAELQAVDKESGYRVIISSWRLFTKD